MFVDNTPTESNVDLMKESRVVVVTSWEAPEKDRRETTAPGGVFEREVNALTGKGWHIVPESLRVEMTSTSNWLGCLVGTTMVVVLERETPAS